MTAALAPGEVRVTCVAPAEVAADRLAALGGLLSVDEEAQRVRYRRAEHGRDYQISRILMRTVLATHTGVAPTEIRFAANRHGRPELAYPRLEPALSFNLSHTRDLIVLGATWGRALGVDVENTAAREAKLAIAERFFAADEVAALRALPAADRPRRFFDYWTLKEAYIKARGQGLSLPLERFVMDLGPPIRLRCEASFDPDAAHWQIEQRQPTERHVLALCVRRDRAGAANLTIRIEPSRLA
jgi:4'-phosphopantetheinyl transferase